MSQQKTIVITGCSSGLGRVTALHLAAGAPIGASWHVFATVRREEDRSSLLSEAAARGCHARLTPFICDITAPEQVNALAQAVAAVSPQLDALLNNAGTTYPAPLEIMTLEDLRAQLEINLVAHVSVTQRLLPLLKAARGTIVNVSSVSGRIATPMLGAYAASKFALEAISDAWRIELAPFGVQVVVIEPDSYATTIWKTGKDRAIASMQPYRGGPYERLFTAVEKFSDRSAAHAYPPQQFAHTVQHILASRHPRPRYVLPRRSRWLLFLRQLLSDRLWDRQVRRLLKW
ncbi:MAG TPA: SDR family NAD(P)-dependent oxidoreductase [Ktedonobacteraceae bacterium]